MQSRNFRLQRVGDIGWLEKNYKFQEISFSLDELIVLNASRGEKDINSFSGVVNRLVNNVFIPVAAGGGIRKLSDADILFASGADKVILNSTLYNNPKVADEIISKYGRQSIIASVDYKLVDREPRVFISDGSLELDISLEKYLVKVQSIGVGEILLNSIDKDGTGFGYDVETLDRVRNLIKTPLIIMGGAGNENHLFEGLERESVSAVATANLFNFIGNGLPNARRFLIENGSNLADWLKKGSK